MNKINNSELFLYEKSALFVIIYFIIIERISSITAFYLLYGFRLKLLFKLTLLLKLLDRDITI